SIPAMQTSPVFYLWQLSPSLPNTRQVKQRFACQIRPSRSDHLDLTTMSRLFGTDGVRGLANGLLTAELAMQLAQAAAVVLGHDRNTNGTRPRAVVARDPRASGEFIAAAVEAGLSSSGIDVY